MRLRRREFITLLGGAAAAWPLAAGGQQLSVPVIGFLNGASAWEYAHLVAAFRQGLGEQGFVEGRNVLIEYRWAEGRYERLPALAAELVSRPVAVIAAGTVNAAHAARSTFRGIPIVFTVGVDPVQSGLVASLSRPGSNLTGVTQMTVEVAPKRLELLHELLPTANVIGLLLNPDNGNVGALSTSLEDAARTLGVTLPVLHARNDREIDTAFASFVKLRAGGLVIGTDAFFNVRSEQLAALALEHKLPAVSQYREFVAAGGLMSYGGSIQESYRIAGIYTGRILKGEKPADLPVQQATRVELFINMKTAKALGLTFPLTLLGRADEVIE